MLRDLDREIALAEKAIDNLARKLPAMCDLGYGEQTLHHLSEWRAIVAIWQAQRAASPLLA